MFQRLLGVLAFLLLAFPMVQAQVTTATIAGQVTDETGNALAGVTIVASHTPSGTSYGTYSREDGRYTLPNLRVGGPYTISLSYTGYSAKNTEGLMLSVGQKLPLN